MDRRRFLQTCAVAAAGPVVLKILARNVDPEE
jgi:hypothetical protein